MSTKTEASSTVRINYRDRLAFDLGYQPGECFLNVSTVWGDKLEFEISVPGDDSRFQYIGMAEAAALRDWLGAWLAARGVAS